MKSLIWLTFGLLTVLWTLLATLSVRASNWLLGAITSGQVTGVPGTAAQAPLPAWLAPWLDPAWLAAPQSLWLAAMDLFVQLAPSSDALMAWIAPLIWAGWALGAAVLLVAALGLHWLVGRLQPATARLDRRS